MTRLMMGWWVDGWSGDGYLMVVVMVNDGWLINGHWSGAMSMAILWIQGQSMPVGASSPVVAQRNDRGVHF